MKTLLLVVILSLSPPIHGTELSLVGKAMLEFSIFAIDIYEISYFKDDKGTEQLLLDYQRDVERKHSIMGWEKGLEPLLKEYPLYKNKMKWIIDHTSDLREGDTFIIRRKKSLVTMFRNNKEIASINDPIIARMVFEPWLGNEPIDIDLKNKLLGIKES